MKPRILVAAALALAVGGLASVAWHQPRPYTVHHEAILGTSLDLTVVATSASAGARGEAAVLGEIARQAAILSAYDDGSEFSRWARTSQAALPVSGELIEVLGLFDRWRARTGGALDPSVEAITRVWRRAADAQRLPDAAEIAAAVRSVGQTHWSLDPAHGAATHLTGVPLALNSLAKSYIVERAARAALRVRGVRGVVVNAGGDLVVRGDWTETVRIADPAADAENSAPLTRLLIADRAVATSGGYRRGFDIGGHHYSHIIDPRSGRPVDHVLSATVVANDAATAGALATAFCVLTPAESRALAGSTPGVEFLIVLKDGGRMQSAAWHTLEPRRETPRGIALPTVYAAGQGSWNPAMELTVSLELARAGGRRPYVAVWIEDKDRFPIRTLALWFQKPRWLPDLKSWYRADRLRALAEGSDLASTISSATRAPGTYTLKWDGKDQQGKPVKAGTYTVCIEAAREHGTYQIIRQEMDFSGAAKQMDLTGNVEIAAASLDYHKLDGR